MGSTISLAENSAVFREVDWDRAAETLLLVEVANSEPDLRGVLEPELRLFL